MADTPLKNSSSEAIAEQLLAKEHHYLDALTKLGDRQSVVATEDIFSHRGIKLVAKGTRIDSRLRERLSGHQLPLDCGLAVENTVTAESLAVAADKQIEQHPFWLRLAARSGDALAMRHGLAAIKLPDVLAFKLTVAREQRPLLFGHSLRVAILAHYLALRLGFDEKKTAHLQLAALCHDLGELHTDPAILDPGHRISDAERRFVYVHPTTGYIILRELPGVPAEVARAVLHHHERLDGSGYPAGLEGARIEPLALPLMVADTADAVLNRSTDYGRLSTALRLNGRKYDSRSVAFLYEAVRAYRDDAAEAVTLPHDCRPQLLALAKLIDDWATFRHSLDEKQLSAGERGLDFLQQRVQNLNSLLFQFGFDPNSFDTLIALAETDPEVAAELAQVIDELNFQLADMAHEIDRRAAEAGKVLNEAQKQAFANWRITLQQSLGQAGVAL